MSSSAPPPPTARPGPVLPFALVVIAVAAVALNLRPGATSVGPVLEEIQQGLGLSPTLAGVLTGLPGFVFGAAGLAAVAIARRLGLVGTLCGALLLVAAALLARAVVDSAALFLLLSALALAGMGIGNVLVPAMIKRHSSGRPAALSSVYTATLGVGTALPVFAAAPLLAAGPGGWRSALGVWAVVALVCAVPWVVLWVRVRGHDEGLGRRPTGPPIHRSRTAVVLCAFFGLQSMNAYVQFGWLAQMYRDAGVDGARAAMYVGIMALFVIPAGLLMPQVVARTSHTGGWTTVLALGTLAGWTGMLLAPAGAPLLWALLLGLGQGIFPLALTLIVALSGTPETTARLSGFAQPVGYVLAALGPLAVGVLRDLTGGWTLPLLMLMASAVLLMVAGLLLSGGRTVDQDLAA